MPSVFSEEKTTPKVVKPSYTHPVFPFEKFPLLDARSELYGCEEETTVTIDGKKYEYPALVLTNGKQILYYNVSREQYCESDSDTLKETIKYYQSTARSSIYKYLSDMTLYLNAITDDKDKTVESDKSEISKYTPLTVLDHFCTGRTDGINVAKTYLEFRNIYNKTNILIKQSWPVEDQASIEKIARKKGFTGDMVLVCEHIHNWMMNSIGQEATEVLARKINPNIESPIVIDYGETRSGKNLRWLAVTYGMTTNKGIFKKFASNNKFALGGLEKTPFYVDDESFCSSPQGVINVARVIAGNHSFESERKNKDPIDIQTHISVMASFNSSSELTKVVQLGQELEDAAAIDGKFDDALRAFTKRTYAFTSRRYVMPGTEWPTFCEYVFANLKSGVEYRSKSNKKTINNLLLRYYLGTVYQSIPEDQKEVFPDLTAWIAANPPKKTEFSRLHESIMSIKNTVNSLYTNYKNGESSQKSHKDGDLRIDLPKNTIDVTKTIFYIKKDSARYNILNDLLQNKIVSVAKSEKIRVHSGSENSAVFSWVYTYDDIIAAEQHIKKLVKSDQNVLQKLEDIA